MSIPLRIPGLNFATVLMAIYTAVWISLEGALAQVLIMGIGVTILTAGHIMQRFFAGRILSLWVWLGLTAVLGLLIGLLSVVAVLLFMAIKTGLHAHGPEFSPAEITWVVQQWLLWAAAGGLGGTAVGLLSIGYSNRKQ